MRGTTIDPPRCALIADAGKRCLAGPAYTRIRQRSIPSGGTYIQIGRQWPPVRSHRRPRHRPQSPCPNHRVRDQMSKRPALRRPRRHVRARSNSRRGISPFPRIRADERTNADAREMIRPVAGVILPSLQREKIYYQHRSARGLRTLNAKPRYPQPEDSTSARIGSGNRISLTTTTL